MEVGGLREVPRDLVATRGMDPRHTQRLSTVGETVKATDAGPWSLECFLQVENNDQVRSGQAGRQRGRADPPLLSESSCHSVADSRHIL